MAVVGGWQVPWTGAAQVLVAFATATALILSIYNFVRDRRRSRVASLSVRYEYSVDGFERIVATNHGPASARDVTLDFGRANDSIGGEREVPELHPGDEHHAMVSRSMGDPFPSEVVTRWHDGRRGSQSTTVHLSPRRVLM